MLSFILFNLFYIYTSTALKSQGVFQQSLNLNTDLAVHRQKCILWVKKVRGVKQIVFGTMNNEYS